MTTAKKPAARKSAAKPVEVDAPVVVADASPEAVRGPLEGVPVHQETEYAERVENPRIVGGAPDDAEPAHSPEVARGPLAATPAESVRHDNEARSA